MKRAPIVITGTALGLAGVHGYAATITASALRPSSPRSPASTPTRSATGRDVNFGYGDLQLRVTMSGSHLTGIAVVRLMVTNPRSASNNRSVVPRLGRAAMAAQSAQIDGVSGASYTSQAYAQSLQSALDKFGLFRPTP